MDLDTGCVSNGLMLIEVFLNKGRLNRAFESEDGFAQTSDKIIIVR
jgi:hypothetical protein